LAWIWVFLLSSILTQIADRWRADSIHFPS
jgi:hypothetical protein